MVTQSDESVIFAAPASLPDRPRPGTGLGRSEHKVQLYRDTALAAGHAAADIERHRASSAQLKQVHVAPTSQQARDEYEKALMWYFAMSANRGMFGFNEEPQPYDYYLQHRSSSSAPPEEVSDRIAAVLGSTPASRTSSAGSIAAASLHEQVHRSHVSYSPRR